MFNKNKSSDAITEIWGNGPKGLKQKTNMKPVIGFCLINKTKLMIDDFDKPANKLTKYETKLLLVTFGIVKRSSPARSKTAMSLELYKKNQFLTASLSQLNSTKCMSRFKILKLVWFWLFFFCLIYFSFSGFFLLSHHHNLTKKVLKITLVLKILHWGKFLICNKCTKRLTEGRVICLLQEECIYRYGFSRL